MVFIPKILPFLLSPIGGALGLFGSKKPTQPLPAATRDDAEQQVLRDDELRRRKGAAADIVTGTRGAEAGGSIGKFVLGS